MKVNSKKVGILTFHKANNLGASLQASALCKFINQNITNCEIIDFVPNNSCGSNLMRKLPIIRALKNYLLDMKCRLSHNKASKFDEFRKHEMSISKKTFYGDVAMKKTSKVYATLISGSDQILNSTLSGKSKSYYLHFDDTAKKISYASSFGRENISENEIELVRTELIKFNAISVREASAASIIKREINRDAMLVVDPVFLLQKEDWQRMQNNILKTSDKYIFVYSMEVSPNLEAIVESLHIQSGLPVIVVRGGGKPGTILGTEDFNCGPRDFLSYISSAEYVITNSFHGTAMSLIFGKKFISVAHSTRNARLHNILEMVQAKDRLVPFDLPLDNMNNYINDGEQLYPLLEPYIALSKNYLMKELKEE